MKPTYPKAPFAAFSKRIEPMKTYAINIAKDYTRAGRRGLPAQKHHARVTLDWGMSESEAVAELDRLQTSYPWPEFFLTLTTCKPPTRGPSFT